MTIDVGQTIEGKYRVVRHIGAGGMGTVYEGENVLIGRRVAIKLLHAQVASLPEFVERFEREAKAAVRIGSPHVCDVYDLGRLPNGDRFIVMEYLEGQSLEDRLEERGKLAAHELAPIAFELLEGLGSMHAAGVIHRDLKPANVFLAKARGGRGETVKILDFGVAKLQPAAGEVGSMTQTGAMMGTPLYMSPEQARGARDVDGRSDIYAASVIFYRALTGVLPYNAANLNELLFKIVLEDPRPALEVAPEVDPEFASLVHRGLVRDLEARIPSARAFQEAIAQWGRLQGRKSLAFDVTLPSDPPPNGLRQSRPDGAVSGPRAEAVSQPAAESAMPGTVVSDRPVPTPGPLTPAGSAKAGPAAGTPLSWAGAPERGSDPGAAPLPTSSAQLAVASAVPASLASTQASASNPELPERTSSRVAPSASESAPAARPRSAGRNVLFGAGAIAVVAALGIALTRGGATASADRGAASSGLADVPSSAVPSSATPTPSSAEPSAPNGPSTPTSAPSSVASAPLEGGAAPRTPTAAAPVVAHGPGSKVPAAAIASASPTPVVAASAPTPVAPASAAPAASSHGRRFRTNLD